MQNRAHIVVTCNLPDLTFELICMRSIQWPSSRGGRWKMGKSSRVALLSLFLIASTSPSFAHVAKIDSVSRTTPAERMTPAVSPENWVAARHIGSKACNYRGGP